MPPFDRSVLLDLNKAVAGSPALVDTLKAISFVFAPLSFSIAAGVVAAWLAYRRRFRVAIWLAFTVMLASLVNDGLKAGFGRARPTVPHPVAHVSGLSFPSGHAFGVAVGVSSLLVVAWPLLRGAWRWVAVAAGVLIVLMVGFARIALGVHYLSDVLGGYAFGLAWFAVCLAAFRPGRQLAGAPRRSGPAPVA